jgi:hypothetical protein
MPSCDVSGQSGQNTGRQKLTCGVIQCQRKFKIDETAIISHELLHGGAAIAPGSMGPRNYWPAQDLSAAEPSWEANIIYSFPQNLKSFGLTKVIGNRVAKALPDLESCLP